MKHIEYEERVLISKTDYENVIEDLKREGKELRHLHIENIYLDNDESFIYKTKKMLRIRHTNNDSEELTLKVLNKDGSTIEINETLDNHSLIDKELNNRFQDYHEIARLITDRIEVEYDNYLFVVDKNEYLDIVDYDLEVEASSQEEARKIIEIYCEKYKLLYDSHYHSKSHRCLSKARELLKK